MDNNHDPIVVISYTRTPMGKFLGELSTLAAHELGSVVIKDLITKSNLNLNNTEIDEVIMGCVLQAGQGQAPARQAALNAGLNYHTGCTTINKMCGSGMKAVMQVCDSLKAGSSDIAIAGGMESMSCAPYLLDKARSGLRLGHVELKDHMFIDGLEDAYDKGKAMGCFAETTAENYNFSREEQDEFAINSVKKSQKAQKENKYKNEITPIKIKIKNKEIIIDSDEGPKNALIDKIPNLRPAFKKNGTVTAANSSSISDGAAGLLLTRQSVADKLNLKPIAKILGYAQYADKPELFTIAPGFAIKKLLHKFDLKISDIDLFEINEAFAVVTMAAIKDLNLPYDKVNINGGACVLGHPIGASGARIMVTLLNALKENNLKTGIAALCIGGGEATAMALEIC